MDEEVDIFQVVRRIQTRRPELLSSVVSLMHLIYEKVIVGVIIFVNFLIALQRVLNYFPFQSFDHDRT
jgi:hypothetical protein